MRGITSTTAIAVAALLLAPAAAATWYSYGSFEPDTPYDDATLMFADPPGTKTNQIYFNAYPKWGPNGANGAVVNPNVGVLETRLDPAGPTSWQAVLGVWTDCNGDGYIGMAETAVREYSDSVLLDKSLCPPTTGKVGVWEGGNNYRGWVTEFIPVGSVETTNGDRKVYKDTAAMVWGDAGVPERVWPDAEPPCFIGFIRGESRSTGGMIRSVDCRGNRGIVDAFDDTDATLGTGLGFGNSENPQNSGSPLNQQTFGDDSSDHSAVYLQDCNADPLLTSGDQQGTDVDDIHIVRPLSPNPVNGDVGSWTIPGTLNATRESITAIPNPEPGAPGSDPEGNCNYGDDGGDDFYGALEGNPAFGQENGKRNAQWNFAFNTASRGSLPATAVVSGSTGAPTDIGVEALGAGCPASSCLVSAWDGPTVNPYTTPVTRGTVGVSDAPAPAGDGPDGDEAQIADAPHWSFYAYVGPETTSRGFVTPGGSGVYGAPQCGPNTSGKHNGWNCNAAEWYLLADGSPQPEPRPFARPGSVYNLRDVDCYDGSLGTTGLGISPAFFGDRPCA